MESVLHPTNSCTIDQAIVGPLKISIGAASMRRSRHSAASSLLAAAASRRQASYSTVLS